MSRKRTLYLSELLIRSVEKIDLALHIGAPYEMYFDSISEAINYLKDTQYWNIEVQSWLQSKWETTNSKWIHTLYVKLK